MSEIEKFLVTYPKDHVIFREGDEGKEMYFVDSGKVKILKRVKNGEKVLAILQRGDFFGEMAVLTGKPRTATAVAMTDVRLLKIGKEDFEAFLRKNIDVAVKLIKKMAERLRETDFLLEMANYRDEKLKITTALLQLARETGERENIVVDPTELHSRSFTTTAILKEALKDLAKKGIIHIKEKNIIVPSLEKLEKFNSFLKLKEEFSFIEEGGKS